MLPGLPSVGAVGLSTGAAGVAVCWCCGSIYWCCGGLPSVGAVGVWWKWLHLTTFSAVRLFVYSYWSAGGAGV